MRRFALLSCAVLTGCLAESSDPQLEDAAPAAPIDASVDTSFAAEETAKAVALLRDLEERLPDLLVDGQFPIGTSAATPGPTCCQAGGVRLCPDQIAAWQGVQMWDALGIAIQGRHAHVYAATSLGPWLLVNALADLNCDGIQGTISLLCVVLDGHVICNLELPDLVE